LKEKDRPKPPLRKPVDQKTGIGWCGIFRLGGTRPARGPANVLEHQRARRCRLPLLCVLRAKVLSPVDLRESVPGVSGAQVGQLPLTDGRARLHPINFPFGLVFSHPYLLLTPPSCYRKRCRR